MVALAVTDAIGVTSIHLVRASINTKMSCPQRDLHYPGFDSIDDVANSMSAKVLPVAFFKFAGISHRLQLQLQCLHPYGREKKSNELDPTFWLCPGALQVCSSCSSCLPPASAKTTLNPQRMHPSN